MVRQIINIHDLRQSARARLPRPVFDYLVGGADDEVTCLANEHAFQNCALIPELMCDVSQVDMSTQLFGEKIPVPIVLAPTGLSRLFHPDGELGIAAAAARVGVPYCVSTMATTSLERVAEVGNGLKCFQLYALKDRDITQDLIQRAKRAGYTALCLTVDTVVAGNRERDRRSGLTVPPSLKVRALLDFTLRPVWLLAHLLGGRLTLENITRYVPEHSTSLSSVAASINELFDRSMTWEGVREIAIAWNGPLAIKGILSAADAQRAVDSGVNTIIVSNHGGRQMDCVPATFSVLRSIVDAVGDRAEIVLDGGVMRGSSIIKALAAGASACMIGRPYLYGLASSGQQGVSMALSILMTELQRGLALMGRNSISKLDRGCLVFDGSLACGSMINSE